MGRRVLRGKDNPEGADSTFEALRSALARNGSIRAPAALAALLSGARWHVYPKSASSQSLWAIWCDRLDMLVETGGSEPVRLESLAQAVDRLHDAGAARVYLAMVTDPPRRFHVYLSEGSCPLRRGVGGPRERAGSPNGDLNRGGQVFPST
ncbi:hypothetical protein GCM10010371_66320 [Streptomyces subrutilus]|uniref:Uncharacterized protein n=1 Tax=Streptomyces subrutilus TaxID=36818 RepID=A0A918RFQ6_9ACTN|nr:hypothetical protein GCM10010371_66320 [Streptomyces subrutilus]